MQSESSEDSETEAETDDSSDSFYHSNNSDAQHSDFVDMESAERKLPVPSEDTNDGHCKNNEDAVAAEDVAGGVLPIDEELPHQEDASESNNVHSGDGKIFSCLVTFSDSGVEITPETMAREIDLK